ncbi:hypothetical protein B6U84_00045 [Candidatus Bathyarchaeota archaeon ex4484_40]|nr:MAG: hypothetical protein B6U84_00045 [Candidatus Bathyarchaeota archaeon ex4484_40]
MVVWFNPKTGEFRSVAHGGTARHLKAQGWRKVLSSGFAKHYYLYSLPSEKTGEYVPIIISRESHRPYTPNDFETYEQYKSYDDKIRRLRSIAWRWADAIKCASDPQYLFEKLISAVKRKKEISREDLKFALSLLPDKLRKEAVATITLVEG